MTLQQSWDMYFITISVSIQDKENVGAEIRTHDSHALMTGAAPPSVPNTKTHPESSTHLPGTLTLVP